MREEQGGGMGGEEECTDLDGAGVDGARDVSDNRKEEVHSTLRGRGGGEGGHGWGSELGGGSERCGVEDWGLLLLRLAVQV